MVSNVLLFEAARLSEGIYLREDGNGRGPSGPGSHWTTAALALAPVGSTTAGADFTFNPDAGVYEVEIDDPAFVSALGTLLFGPSFRQTTQTSIARITEASVDGRNTLALTFLGTDVTSFSPLSIGANELFDQVGQWDNYYAAMKPIVDAAIVKFQAGGYDDFLITGHSLGGILATYFATDPDTQSVSENTSIVTIAAPGQIGVTDSSTTHEVVNVVHNTDPVLQLSDLVFDRIGTDIVIESDFPPIFPIDGAHDARGYLQSIGNLTDLVPDIVSLVQLSPRAFGVGDGLLRTQEDPSDFDDNLFGERGIGNEIYGLNGNDTVFGRELADTLFGGAGRDSLIGGGGDDVLFGNDGPDVLGGGIGNDTLNAGMGANRSFGGDGNDVLEDIQGIDFFDGGSGTDIAEFEFTHGDSSITAYDEGVVVNKEDVTAGLIDVEILRFEDQDVDVSTLSLETARIHDRPTLAFKDRSPVDGGIDGRLTLDINLSLLDLSFSHGGGFDLGQSVENAITRPVEDVANFVGDVFSSVTGREVPDVELDLGFPAIVSGEIQASAALTADLTGELNVSTGLMTTAFDLDVPLTNDFLVETGSDIVFDTAHWTVASINSVASAPANQIDLDLDLNILGTVDIDDFNFSSPFGNTEIDESINILSFDQSYDLFGADFDVDLLSSENPSDFLQFSGILGDPLSVILDATGINLADYTQGSQQIPAIPGASIGWDLTAIDYRAIGSRLGDPSPLGDLVVTGQSRPIAQFKIDIDDLLIAALTLGGSELLDANGELLTGYFELASISDESIDTKDTEKENSLWLLYDLLDADIEVDLHLVQQQIVQVTDTNITITPESGESQSGSLGSRFNFTAPETGDGSLGFDIAYELGGTVDTSYGVAFSISMPFNLLDLEIGLGKLEIDEALDARSTFGIDGPSFDFAPLFSDKITFFESDPFFLFSGEPWAFEIEQDSLLNLEINYTEDASDAAQFLSIEERDAAREFNSLTSAVLTNDSGGSIRDLGPAPSIISVFPASFVGSDGDDVIIVNNLDQSVSTGSIIWW